MGALMASGRSGSLDCSQLGLPCTHRMGVRPQRVLRVALGLDPTELDQGVTRDRCHRYQMEKLTRHDMHIYGEIMESWS